MGGRVALAFDGFSRNGLGLILKEYGWHKRQCCEQTDIKQDQNGFTC